MEVGRRPYTIRALADRLEDIRDMELTPTWLPSGLRCFLVAVVATALSGVLVPARYRRLGAVIPAATCALAVTIWRAADESTWLTTTASLTMVVALSGVATVCAVAR